MHEDSNGCVGSLVRAFRGGLVRAFRFRPICGSFCNSLHVEYCCKHWHLWIALLVWCVLVSVGLISPGVCFLRPVFRFCAFDNSVLSFCASRLDSSVGLSSGLQNGPRTEFCDGLASQDRYCACLFGQDRSKATVPRFAFLSNMTVLQWWLLQLFARTNYVVLEIKFTATTPLPRAAKLIVCGCNQLFASRFFFYGIVHIRVLVIPLFRSSIVPAWFTTHGGSQNERLMRVAVLSWRTHGGTVSKPSFTS